MSDGERAEVPDPIPGEENDLDRLPEDSGLTPEGLEEDLAEKPQEEREHAGEPESLIRISQEDLQKGVEAVLFSTGEPVPIRQLAELFEVSIHDIREVVEELRLEYVNSGRAFRIEDISGGVQILTLPRYEPWIRRYLSKARDARLSAAAFETLAVIAYKQPITKADLEAIRGVQCAPILKTLMDRNLIKVVGREDTLGKPLLYGTTKRFLESFGLPSLSGLPQPDLDIPGASGPPAEGGGAESA